MGFSAYEFDKKSYRESKRRRRQAMLQSETGVIKPYRRGGKRKLWIILAAAVLVCAVAAVPVCLYCFPAASRQSAAEDALSLSREERLRPVNKAEPLAPSDVPELAEFENVKVHASIAGMLEAMRDAAKQQGIDLKVTDGYVSYEEQQKRYEENLAPYLKNPKFTPVRAQAAAQRIVPEAGCSEAQTGLYVEFDIADPRAKAFVERECIHYGLIQRYAENKEEITHMQRNDAGYRFVGVEDAEKMRAFDMCLEEYADYVDSQYSVTLYETNNEKTTKTE